VGFRPSPGLVPTAPAPLPLFGFNVKGPLGRSVEDAALLLSVMAGRDDRDPLSIACDRAAFAAPLGRDFRGVRVAWCPDLGGLPVDPQVREVIDGRRGTFEEIGCRVEEACPDLTGAERVFLDIRSWMSSTVHGPLVAAHCDRMKPEALWEIDRGSRLSAADIGRALVQHGEILERMRRFEESYEFLICIVNQVPPFDAELDWPKAIDGVKMEHYIAWMKSTYWVSVTSRPAISVPAGFTTDGLPVGIQIVGRYRDELGVLQLAHAFEQATGFGLRRPGTAPQPSRFTQT
jgi:amidase